MGSAGALTAIWLLVLLGPASGERLKLTDSFLPAAAQVLQNIVDNLAPDVHDPELEGYTPPPETTPQPERNEAAEAYRLILSRLRTSLSTESKLRGIREQNGFSDELLQKLKDMRPKTSKDQLESLLKLIVEDGETNWKPVMRMSKFVLNELRGNDTELGEILSKINPLKYT